MTLTINVIDREGNNHTIEAFEDQPIAQAISQHIKPNEFMICGGCCACGTCAINVDSEWKDTLPDVGVDEDSLLDTVERTDNSRLSCQVPMTKDLDGIKVIII
jgi:2Fe-2S ferredoxin